jgi:hypothetical protein
VHRFESHLIFCFVLTLANFLGHLSKLLLISMHQGEQGGRRKDAGVRCLRENTVFCYLDGNSRVCITSAGHRSFLWVGEEASFTDRD